MNDIIERIARGTSTENDAKIVRQWYDMTGTATALKAVEFILDNADDLRRQLSADLRLSIAESIVSDVATVEVEPMAAFGMWAERNQYNLDDAEARAAAIAEYGQ